jgi:hypothetical protein
MTGTSGHVFPFCLHPISSKSDRLVGVLCPGLWFGPVCRRPLCRVSCCLLCWSVVFLALCPPSVDLYFQCSTTAIMKEGEVCATLALLLTLSLVSLFLSSLLSLSLSLLSLLCLPAGCLRLVPCLRCCFPRRCVGCFPPLFSCSSPARPLVPVVFVRCWLLLLLSLSLSISLPLSRLVSVVQQ